MQVKLIAAIVFFVMGVWWILFPPPASGKGAVPFGIAFFRIGSPRAGRYFVIGMGVFFVLVALFLFYQCLKHWI